VSFPCGLEHLRRCTRSTRWWSVDCGTYANRGTLALIIFSWSFPVNWYIQSIHYTPQSKSVTFVSASSPMRNCRLVVVVLYSKAFIPTSGIQTPSPRNADEHFVFLFHLLQLRMTTPLPLLCCCCCWSIHAVVGIQLTFVHTPPMTCILPLSFFFLFPEKIFHLLPRTFGELMYDSFMCSLRFAFIFQSFFMTSLHTTRVSLALSSFAYSLRLLHPTLLDSRPG